MADINRTLVAKFGYQCCRYVNTCEFSVPQSVSASCRVWTRSAIQTTCIPLFTIFLSFVLPQFLQFVWHFFSFNMRYADSDALSHLIHDLLKTSAILRIYVGFEKEELFGWSIYKQNREWVAKYKQAIVQSLVVLLWRSCHCAFRSPVDILDTTFVQNIFMNMRLQSRTVNVLGWFCTLLSPVLRGGNLKFQNLNISHSEVGEDSPNLDCAKTSVTKCHHYSINPSLKINKFSIFVIALP